MDDEAKNKRGFAAWTPDKHRAASSKGGKNIPAEKRTFSRSTDVAAAAGKKGGVSTAPEKRTFFSDRSLARAAGKKGGLVKKRAGTAASGSPAQRADDPDGE